MDEEILQKAKEVAEKAGSKTLELFGKSKVVRKKSPTDIVTTADLASDEIIYQGLGKNFPKFNYLSEERLIVDKRSEYTWVVDPLDGTTSFSAGLEYWGISIGLLKGNKPYLGIINIPIRGWLLWASLGNGSFLNGKRIHVSKNSDYESSIVGFDVGHKGNRREDLVKNIASQIENVRYMPSFQCAVIGQLFVAKGNFDAYIHHRCFIWDFCAGAIIVTEAGGKFTNHKGREVNWTQKENFSILASNGLVHDRILQEVKV